MYKKQTKKNVDSRISMKTSMRGILLLLVILQSGIIFLAQSENNTFVILLSVSILLGLLASATLGFLAIRKITVLTSDMEKNMLEAQYQLDYDALTQLNSRTAFYRKTYELIAESPQTKGAMLFIDLDNLKYVNDTFGHEYGDLYLITASQIFSDIAQEIGVASRMSGDEFAVFIHGFETDEAARDYVKNKLDVHKLVSINLPDGTTQRVRFSSGLSYYPSDSCNIKELVKYADFAMYEAKHTVKGSMREFNRDIYAEKIYLMENREAINQLIEDRRVRFMFQPIVSAKTGEIYAYEALMRSEHSMFKSPLEILKVAATQFKLSELEDMIIRKAVETAYENRHQFGTRKIYINSIASQMISPEIYLELEEEYGEFLKQIVIEITESEDDAPEKMTEKVLAIKGYGMGLAIDDFGRGFTNELKIIAINPDVIKINMDLLHGIYEDKDKQTLCANIIAYSHSKGICIVAEGIEQVEDLKTVVELGADYLQGYYLAKPSFNPVEILEEKKEIIVRLQDHIFK